MLVSIWNRIVRCFLAGAFAVLPLVITVAIVMWVTGFIERFIGPNTFLGGLLSNLGFSIAERSPGAIAYVIGWIVVLLCIFALGILIDMGAKRILQRIVEGVVKRVPLIGSIYSTSKQMVEMLDKKDEAALKGMSAVFCFFGKEQGTGVLALLVSPERYCVNGIDYHIVIVPTAPVPFGGGLLFVPADNVVVADMSVDGLMSIYVSMGVTAPEFLPNQPSKLDEKT